MDYIYILYIRFNKNFKIWFVYLKIVINEGKIYKF